MESKAWHLHYGAEQTGDRGAAILAFQQWRERCEPRSDDWATATWALAVQYQISRRFSEALKLRLELIGFDATPESLLDASESNISLEQNVQAAKWLAEAEKLIASIASDRPDDKQRKERLTVRAEDLKRRMGRPDN